ncbi:type I-E CRISPR-associated protein Cse2/CasB [Microbacterium tumbae]
MNTASTETLTDRLRRLVAGRASKLQTDYRNNLSSAVADLAILRRGVGRRPGEDAELLGKTVAGLHRETKGLPDEPTNAEHAAHAALTLFALHQQSHREASMHRKDYSFGRSARLLGRRIHAQDAVRARFTAVATATSWDELVHHARGLIQQFRAQGIPLDYGRFAVDLYRLQFPDSAERVRLRWGRDYYRVLHPEDDGEAEAAPTDD